MNRASPHQPDNAPSLETTREVLRRELNRTTAAMGVILLAVIGLALAAILAGVKATRNLTRAEQAESASRERLWHSYLAQARAVRLTPDAGRRQAVLDVISNAASIRVASALRTEAIAALALSDLQTDIPVKPIPRGTEQIEMDSVLERYAYGDATGTVYVARLTDGEVLQTLRAQELGPGTRLGVRSVAFNPQGDKLAARFEGGAMVIWEIASGRALVTSGVNATNVLVAGMSFWPDKDVVSFGDADAQGQITVYDFTTEQRLHSAIRVGARTFRFRPGTMQVAVAADNRVELFEYPGETKLQTLDVATRIFTMTWSPNANHLAVSTEDGDIYLWDLGRGNHRVFRGHSEPCIRLAFSPDGELLLSGSRDGTSRLWDVEVGQTLAIATEGLGHVFGNDGERIGFWKPAVGFGTWRLTRSETYSQLVCPKNQGAFLSLDLSPNGRWCVATQSKGIRIWDLENDAREAFIPVDELLSVRLAPDESSLYVCRRSRLERWPFHPSDPDRLTDTNSITSITLPNSLGARAITLSLDGRRAVVELSDLRLAVLDLAGAQPPVFLKEKCRFASLRTPASATGAGRFAISPDGKWVATGFAVGRVDQPMIWDADTGDLVKELPFGTAVVGFSADGKWLGTAGVASFGIWSVGDWKQANSFKRDEPALTHGSMAFTRDGGEVAVTRTRQQAQLRNAFTDASYADFTAPQLQSVTSLRMSLDGSVLVTASAADKLQVWNLKTARQKLASIGLDWNPAHEKQPIAGAIAPAPMSPTQITLLVSLVGCGLVAVFALATLQRHRRTIAGYLAAESRAVERNRELEAAKVELMHSQKMQALGTLAAGIAHDFNNLLSVIRMSNKLIGRETKQLPDVQEHVGDIEQAVLQGKNVVGSMLGYSRNDADTGEPTDVNAVVEEAVSLLSKEFLSGIALTLELDREAPRVAVGRGQLEQVLLNLIVNASEAMQGHGKLKISVHVRHTLPPRHFVLRPGAEANGVELSVADSGPGIAPEIRARMFEPFFTTKRSASKAGTGLGLSLVYSIAERDRLGLSVESEPGKGAVFSLFLPTAPVRQTHSVRNPDPPYAVAENDGN
jgi:signal transduction histidine kinase